MFKSRHVNMIKNLKHSVIGFILGETVEAD